jgi:hypothetical protein
MSGETESSRARLFLTSGAAAPIVIYADGDPVVFGSALDCDQTFLDMDEVAPHHFEVRPEAGRFWVRDLGSVTGTSLNGVAVTGPRQLFDGDLISFGGGLQVRFEGPRDEGWEALVARHEAALAGDALEPWLVFADELVARGDSMGALMLQLQAGQPVASAALLGRSLDGDVQRGTLRITARAGFVQTAVFPSVPPGFLSPSPADLQRLLRLRTGRLLRRVALDIVPLDEGAVADAPRRVEQAQRALAAMPELPPTLESLFLGYRYGGNRAESIPVSPALVARAPRLAGTMVYESGRVLRLTVDKVKPGVQLVGLEAPLPLERDVRIVARAGGLFVIEAVPTRPLEDPDTVALLTVRHDRLVLHAFSEQRLIRVGGLINDLYALLPGDVIQLGKLAWLRVDFA